MFNFGTSYDDKEIKEKIVNLQSQLDQTRKELVQLRDKYNINTMKIVEEVKRQKRELEALSSATL